MHDKGCTHCIGFPLCLTVAETEFQHKHNLKYFLHRPSEYLRVQVDALQ